MNKHKQTTMFSFANKVAKHNAERLPSLPQSLLTVTDDEDARTICREGSSQGITPSSDISDLVKLVKCSDESRLSMLINKFKPSNTWQGPQRDSGKLKRRVPAFVFHQHKYPTLSYSVKEDSVYCATCAAFSKSSIILVSKPLKDWSNAKKQVDQHIATKEHITATLKASEFLKVSNNTQAPITHQLNEAYKAKVEQNRKALSTITETIILCGKQKHCSKKRER